MYKLFCISKTTVQVNRADQGFHGVADNGVAAAPSGRFLALAQQQVFPQADVSGAVGQGRFAYDAGADLGQIPLGQVLVFVV